MNLAHRSVASTWGTEPRRDVSVRSASDALDIDVAGGIVVASLVTAVGEGALRCALSGRNSVRKRHAAEA